MDGKSFDVLKDKMKKLKGLFPEIFVEGKVDAEKLKLTLGENINENNERYTLNWAGKAEAFRVLQTPTTATLIPAREESVNFDKTNHIFIEGENLEVLKVLQKSYFGKIKMIYIDPPYNTGNDSFIYPDRFYESKDDYLKRIGEKDEEGYLLKEGLFRKNSKENGQFHSNWLSMMYPRLFLARNLLRDDGVIFVSIDDNEVHNLRLLMNEVFGEENFVASIVWQKKYGPANDAMHVSETHEYILLYSKNSMAWVPKLFARTEEQLSAFKNPDNDPRGEWRASDLSARTASQNCMYPITLPNGRVVYPPNSRSWICSKERFEELLKDKRIWFGVDGDGRPMQKTFLSEVKEGITPQTWWDRDFAGDNKIARYELKDIFPENVFDTPKPSKLLRKFLEIATSNSSNDIVLDFFSGSGTTAHAILNLNKEDDGNRKFICAQLPEKCDEDSDAFKAGYKTIAEIGKERIRRVIRKIKEEKKNNPDLFDKNKNELDLGFKVFKLRSSNFKIWRSDVIENGDDLARQLEAFKNPVKPEAEQMNMLWEILVKSGYDLNTSIEERKAKDCSYYSIKNNELVVILDKINEAVIKEIIKSKPRKCICLDSLFSGNDQLKTNTVLQMKDSGVEFKTL